ncbi:MAG: acireductone dioxygenase [Pseudomonadota bacterium]|nr:acireductone dioxygenase [Pseudomonadota bacterium]
MTWLTVHPEHDAGTRLLASSDASVIAGELQRRGVRFERPAGLEALPAGVTVEQALAACGALIARQKAVHGYTVVDAVSVHPDLPGLEQARAKFLSEHTHAEDEARLMVDGAGTFYLRAAGEVLVLELCAGDLISVPQGMRHWFDMGARPRFTAVRLFTRPDGWIGSFTGDAIAERFPRYAGAA